MKAGRQSTARIVFGLIWLRTLLDITALESAEFARKHLGDTRSKKSGLVYKWLTRQVVPGSLNIQRVAKNIPGSDLLHRIALRKLLEVPCRLSKRALKEIVSGNGELDRMRENPKFLGFPQVSDDVDLKKISGVINDLEIDLAELHLSAKDRRFEDFMLSLIGVVDKFQLVFQFGGIYNELRGDFYRIINELATLAPIQWATVNVTWHDSFHRNSDKCSHRCSESPNKMLVATDTDTFEIAIYANSFFQSKLSDSKRMKVVSLSEMRETRAREEQINCDSDKPGVPTTETQGDMPSRTSRRVSHVTDRMLLAFLEENGRGATIDELRAGLMLEEQVLFASIRRLVPRRKIVVGACGPESKIFIRLPLPDEIL